MLFPYTRIFLCAEIVNAVNTELHVNAVNCLLAGFALAEIQKMNVHMTRYLNFLSGSLSLARGREGNGNCCHLCVTNSVSFVLFFFL